ncbi:MAG TPA: polysaccharide deacetylase family protein [Stellaceae bacterium]|nr:polysaccharide deacetylase family protein [Stellaceae bacterium]
MTYLPRVAAANGADWVDLVDELDRWEEAGRVAQFWWRDDDAVAPTPQLDRLLALADGAPLALAVIPAGARDDLASALRWFPQVAVLHHGWCHKNHADSGKSSEYPPERHPVDVADEIEEGRKRLRALFGGRALPVFVPPWNRFSERFVPLLEEAGFTAISQMAPRKNAPADKLRGLAIIDTHLDVVAWHEDRGFVGEREALDRLITELRARREGRDEATIGVLTHHLAMDRPTEDFLARLGKAIDAHPAARWADVSELLP